MRSTWRVFSVGVAAILLSLALGTGLAHAGLSPYASETGKISLSVDALGTNDPAGGPIRVQKNAGATVRKAYLFGAKTPGTGALLDGDVTLDGTPVVWDPTSSVESSFGNFTAAADVTSIVKPVVDSAPAGIVNFTVAEGANTDSYDGEILAVILDDPTVTTSGSVILLYGTEDTSGDTFPVALSQPVDKTNPSFALDLSLGISFGYQPAGQYSTVAVNGHLMTSSAGGQDDCVEKYAATPNFPVNCSNGELITAGGIGDLNDNPPDPTATDETCMGAMGPAPRCDDELYNLLPFVNNGDTSLTFNTTNPSNNDDILFAALNVHGSAALVGEGVVLGPVTATNPVGTNHTFTATVQDTNGNPVSGVTVTFTATSGPNAGRTGTGVTDSNGHATFTYSSTLTGTDTWVASFKDSSGTTHTSNPATKTWTASTGDTTPPSCSLASTIAGPPKQIQVMVQDTGSGLASVHVDTSVNATTAVPAFTSGTTSAVLVTSTKVDQTKSSSLALTVTDVAGNVTRCDPMVPGIGGTGTAAIGTARTFGNLHATQSRVTITNASTSAGTFSVLVNHKVFVVNVAAGLSRMIDVASAMRSGHDNRIVVRPRNAKKARATVTVTS